MGDNNSKAKDDNTGQIIATKSNTNEFSVELPIEIWSIIIGFCDNLFDKMALRSCCKLFYSEIPMNYIINYFEKCVKTISSFWFNPKVIGEMYINSGSVPFKIDIYDPVEYLNDFFIECPYLLRYGNQITYFDSYKYEIKKDYITDCRELTWLFDGGYIDVISYNCFKDSTLEIYNSGNRIFETTLIHYTNIFPDYPEISHNNDCRDIIKIIDTGKISEIQLEQITKIFSINFKPILSGFFWGQIHNSFNCV